MLTTTSLLCHGFNNVLGLTHVVEHPWVHHLRHLLVQFGHLGRVHVLRHVAPWWTDTHTHTECAPYPQTADPSQEPIYGPICLTFEKSLDAPHLLDHLGELCVLGEQLLDIPGGNP